MSDLRSRLRSELPNLVETRRILTKIAFLYSQKTSRVVFEVGSTRFRAQDCTSVAITPSGTTGNIQFRRPGPAAAAASVTIQNIKYTAAATGTGGNAITVAYTTGATAGSEVVTVVGNAISVQIATGVSTATQVKAAVDASAPAHALATTTIIGTASTAQTAPVTATHLAGGVSASALETYDLADLRIIKRLRTKKYLIAIKGNANPA